MSGGSGGGGNTAGASMPLMGWQRADIMSAGENALSQYLPGAAGQYNAPEFQGAAVYDPGAAERMSGGDYNALEQSILQSRTAPLQEAYGLALTQNDADMAKRGIWSSGAATRGQLDTQAKFGTLLNQAAGEAATQRYGLQAQDINSANQYNLGRAQGLNTAGNSAAGMANQFNLTNEQARQASAWTPANYAAGIWNGTGGTISQNNGTTSGGWNFLI